MIVTFARFCGVLVRSVGNPFNGGADWKWCVTWLITCTGILIGAVLLPTRWKRAVLLIPVVLAALCVVLSHSGGPALVALLLFGISTSAGVAAVQKLIGNNARAIEYFVCGVPIGIGIVSSAMLLLGLFGLLNARWIWLTVGILCLWAAKRWLRNIQLLTGAISKIREFPFTPEAAVPLFIMSWLSIFYLSWTLAPEIQYDALNYHLAIPAKYLHEGRLVEVPFFHGYFAHIIEFFIIAVLSIGGPQAAKLIIFSITICAAIAAYALGNAILNKHLGFWAAALYLTTPFVGWLSGSVYIDSAVSFFVAASFLALLRWQESRDNGWLYLVSLLAGIAVGSKLNASFAYVFIAPVIFVQATRVPRSSAAFRCLLRAAGFGLAFALPTYLVTYAFTGNPVFPLLNGVFRSPKWNFENTIMNAADYGISMNLANLARFPFRLVFDTIRFGDGTPRGAIGFTLLLLFPFAAFLLPRASAALRLMVLAVTGYLVLLFFTMQYARYYILILPLVSVISVAVVSYLVPRPIARLVPAFLLLIVIVHPLIYSVQFWNIPERLPVGVVLGREQRQAFLQRALPGYSAARYLNTVLTKDDKVLGVGVENVRFYLEPQLITPSLALYDDPVRKLSDLHADSTVAEAIKNLRIRYLFVTKDTLKDTGQSWPYVHHSFLESFAVREFEDQYTAVYRLR